MAEVAAQRVIGLGLDLRWRLHATSTEFATGEIDQIRAQAISDVLANVSEDRVATIENLLLDGSMHLNTSRLRAKARRLIARHDPEGAKRRRERADDDRDVRFRANDDGTCAIEGTLPGPGGQVVAMRLRRMCFEVCGRDPRTFAQRRADALIALAAGAGHLECRCGRRDCPATGPRPDPAATAMNSTDRGGAPGPDTGDTASGTAEPNPDTGSDPPPTTATMDEERRSPAPAIVPSTDSNGATNAAGKAAPNPVAEPGPSQTTATTAAEPGGPAPALATLPPATIHVRVNVTTLLGLDDLPGYLAGHGWIDADLAREIAGDGTWRKVLTLTEADREAVLDALCGHTGPGVAPPRRRSTRPTSAASRTAVPEPEPDPARAWLAGRRVDVLPHGAIVGIGRALRAAGITPAAIHERSRAHREQLTYRPSTRLAEIVRARDGICRFPGCSARAITCDIDHTIPFDHAQPERGGLTVEQNLACPVPQTPPPEDTRPLEGPPVRRRQARMDHPHRGTRRHRTRRRIQRHLPGSGGGARCHTRPDPHRPSDPGATFRPPPGPRHRSRPAVRRRRPHPADRGDRLLDADHRRGRERFLLATGYRRPRQAGRTGTLLIARLSGTISVDGPSVPELHFAATCLVPSGGRQRRSGATGDPRTTQRVPDPTTVYAYEAARVEPRSSGS
ncbi:hypothetical protein GCM10023094_04870 [Rhodococcus olei]|uniref:DUF222 domain-containing protein n=1 Tax=Rhodococcus olei TaxID=2161675 RepID=A0ABP8NW83_9NOCA